MLHHFGAGIADAAKGVGFFLLGWTIFTVYIFVCALNINGMLFAALGFLTLTFLFLALGELTTSDGMTEVGGYLGLVTALIAWYGSMAGVMNATASAPCCRCSAIGSRHWHLNGEPTGWSAGI